MRQGQPFYSGGTWERMTPDAVPDSIATSLAHGWGSGPTSALSKYVLGVQPVEAGYNGQTVAGVDASRQPNGRVGHLYLQNLRPGAHFLQVTATGQ